MKKFLLLAIIFVAAMTSASCQDAVQVKQAPYQGDSRYLQLKDAQKAVTVVPWNVENQNEVAALSSYLQFMEWCFVNSTQQRIAVTKDKTVVPYADKDAASYVRDTIVTVPIPNTFENYISYLFGKITTK